MEGKEEIIKGGTMDGICKCWKYSIIYAIVTEQIDNDSLSHIYYLCSHI